MYKFKEQPFLKRFDKKWKGGDKAMQRYGNKKKQTTYKLVNIQTTV